MLTSLRSSAYPSLPFATPLSSAYATAPCTLRPRSHCIPVATVLIYPPSIIPCCIEGEKRGEKGWEPNRDTFPPAPEKAGPRGRGSSFSGAVLGGEGGLALSMSFPTLFHQELDTRARAIAHRLKQSVVQDNSINCERKSIARRGLRGASRARGNQSVAPAPVGQGLRSQCGRKGWWREKQLLKHPLQQRGRGMLEPGFLRSHRHPRPSPGIEGGKGEDLSVVINEGEPGGGSKLYFW